MRVHTPSVAFAFALSLATSLVAEPSALAASASATTKESPVVRAEAQAVARVTAAGAFSTVEHLASPEYAGRLTGTGGYEAAAEWVAEECKHAGLQPVKALKANVSALATKASEKLGKRINFGGEDVLANDDYCKAGYGVLGEQEREAICLFANKEGLLLDPVYTGRAAAGMIDLIRRGVFQKNETVLFWNTGGQPALFAEKYQPEIL